MHQWFLKDDVWHAFLLNAPEAACGEVNIAYGVDPIAQQVPAGGEAHDACVAALTAEEESDDETEEKPSLAKRTSTKKGKS